MWGALWGSVVASQIIPAGCVFFIILQVDVDRLLHDDDPVLYSSMLQCIAHWHVEVLASLGCGLGSTSKK